MSCGDTLECQNLININSPEDYTDNLKHSQFVRHRKSCAAHRHADIEMCGC